MNEDTSIKLKSLGVLVPICQNCKSEDFEFFTVRGNEVINCDVCNFNWKQDVSRDKGTTHPNRGEDVELPPVRS